MYTEAVTVISYLCTIFGLVSAAGYAVTFYFLDYNQLYLSGQSGYDDTDLPYTYAIVECVTSGFTLVIGVLAFATSGRPTKKAVMIALFFFGAACVLEGTFSMLRAWNLGLIGDDMEKTCSDVGQATGCPTSRFEDVHDRDILYSEPSGGDCTFWFWGNKPAAGAVNPVAMTRLIDIIKPNADGTGYANPEMQDGTYFGLDPRDVETYMDWSRPSSYGWRDDPNALANIGAENDDDLDNLDALNLNKRHNMRQIMTLQDRIVLADDDNIPASDRLTQAPSISYCWYWGCNAVCHGERYLANRLWFVSSVTLFALQLVNAILASIVYRRTPHSSNDKHSEAKIEADPTDDQYLEDPELMPPLRGRIKRQLVKNPQGLMF